MGRVIIQLLHILAKLESCRENELQQINDKEKQGQVHCFLVLELEPTLRNELVPRLLDPH